MRTLHPQEKPQSGASLKRHAAPPTAMSSSSKTHHRASPGRHAARRVESNRPGPSPENGRFRNQFEGAPTAVTSRRSPAVDGPVHPCDAGEVIWPLAPIGRGPNPAVVAATRGFTSRFSGRPVSCSCFPRSKATERFSPLRGSTRKYRPRRAAVSGLIACRPAKLSLKRLGGAPVGSWLRSSPTRRRAGVRSPTGHPAREKGARPARGRGPGSERAKSNHAEGTGARSGSPQRPGRRWDDRPPRRHRDQPRPRPRLPRGAAPAEGSFHDQHAAHDAPVAGECAGGRLIPRSARRA